MYFAAGGEYGKDREFRLVGTTGEGSTPYVVTDNAWANILYDATKNHAHLYELTPIADGQFIADAVLFGNSQTVGGPSTVIISGALALNLSCVISDMDYWGEFLKCAYCGGNCVNEPDDSDWLCDGFAGDIENLYE